MSAENAASEAAQTLLSSDKTAYVVSGATIGAGVVGNIAELQSWLSIGATAAGILLTCVLLVKHIIGTLREWKELNK